MKNIRSKGTVNRTNKTNKVEHIAKFFRNHDKLAADPGGKHKNWLINAFLVNRHFAMTAIRNRGYSDYSVFTASLYSFIFNVRFLYGSCHHMQSPRLSYHETFQSHDSSQPIAVPCKDWI